MIKKLVKILLLGLIILLASKGFIAFTVYQGISKLKEQHADNFLLTYQWASSSLDGVVSIKGLEITPYAMKRTFAVDEVRLIYSDYVSLFTALPALSRGQLSALKEVYLPNIQTGLTGKSFKEHLLPDLDSAWFTPFNLYACDQYTSLSDKEYELMGIKQHNMSLRLQLEQIDQGFENLAIDLDRRELGEFSVAVKLPVNSVQRAITNNKIDDLRFHSLMFEYQDSGFFRRLNILCNQSSSENRAVFSMKAAAQWKNAMFAKGLLINETLIRAYADYLLQGGTISIEARDDEGIRASDLNKLVDKEIFSHFDAKVMLNGMAVESPQFYADSATLFPPPVIEPEVKLQNIETQKRPAGYRNINIEFLAEYIDRKIRVVMQDSKIYEGLLTQTSEYNLELTQILTGGAVHYPLMLNQIETFEVWFNQEK